MPNYTAHKVFTRQPCSHYDTEEARSALPCFTEGRRLTCDPATALSGVTAGGGAAAGEGRGHRRQGDVGAHSALLRHLLGTQGRGRAAARQRSVLHQAFQLAASTQPRDRCCLMICCHEQRRRNSEAHGAHRMRDADPAPLVWLPMARPMARRQHRLDGRVGLHAALLRLPARPQGGGRGAGQEGREQGRQGVFHHGCLH